jgi:hypothetical protein
VQLWCYDRLCCCGSVVAVQHVMQRDASSVPAPPSHHRQQQAKQAISHARAATAAGVITELVIQARPVAKVRVHQSVGHDADVAARLQSLAAAGGSSMALWRACFNRLVVTRFSEVPADTPRWAPLLPSCCWHGFLRMPCI